MKICQKDTCGFPVFSHGYCQRHQYLRTDKKFTKIKARKPGRLRKRTQVQIFHEKWNGSNKSSEISGRDLSWIKPDTPLWHSCFAHILNKNKYPRYRTLIDNIMLVYPMEHTLIDSGTIGQRSAYERQHNCSFDIFYERQEQLKQQYKNGMYKISS